MPNSINDIKLRTLSTIKRPEAIVIGASTGGLKAVGTLLDGLKDSKINLPILITQHVPENFDASFTENIAKASGIKTITGVEGDEVVAGVIYVAPSNYHMSVVRFGEKVKIGLVDSPQINFCKPSVDPLFSSASKVWKEKVFGIMLTGIGNDGLEGSKAIVKAGGTIIAQDEATSVVWGMPGAVAKEGLCTAVLPINEIAGFLKKNSYGKIF